MTQHRPTFEQYCQALERLRRRAHQRRAVMTRGVDSSVEMPAFDEEERRDQALCQRWQEQNGFQPGLG